MTESADMLIARRKAVDEFVSRRFGPGGTLRLHRAALGLDLLRAPINVALSPVFLLTRLGAALSRLVRLRSLSRWLGARRIFLPSDIGRQIDADLISFLGEMHQRGLLAQDDPQLIRKAVDGYTETRNAVAEITTSTIVLALGSFAFHRPTPGVISLAGPIAELRARARAIEEFALGSGLGRIWQGLFPAEPSAAQILATGVALAVGASVITTFAGLLADPVQTWLGTHRRRLMRMLDRLDKQADIPALEREHLLARAGDLLDALLVTWRSLR
ncbi:DUF6635 family protein [Paracoccus seriniphilus]|uniref:DUF6635 family protein n=1 Tax=Paracoccus seriniphilus TaxID=184748 RepID=UPI0035655B63